MKNRAENFIKSNKEYTIYRKKQRKTQCCVLWITLFALLVPLTDGQSKAAKRAEGLLNGGNAYVVTRYIPDVQPEWKTVQLIEKIKNIIKK